MFMSLAKYSSGRAASGRGGVAPNCKPVCAGQRSDFKTHKSSTTATSGDRPVFGQAVAPNIFAAPGLTLGELVEVHPAFSIRFHRLRWFVTPSLRHPTRAPQQPAGTSVAEAVAREALPAACSAACQMAVVLVTLAGAAADADVGAAALPN